MEGNVAFAFVITLFAGLATGIGSLIALVSKQTNKRLLAVALGFSAGVMIYVSFVEIFQKARESLVSAAGEVQGNWLTAAAFFAGMLGIGLIDKLVPSYENPHEIRGVEEMETSPEQNYEKLMKTGIFVALAIAIHNFPEGLATFVSALQDTNIGISIGFAIGIHNIPESIAVSIPIFYATNSRRKAFCYSFLSGLAEPAGALIGYLILLPFINDFVFGLLFSAVAGIMVFISIDELLPAAQKYGEHHLSIYGLVLGMAVMALSLLLFI